LLLCCHSVPQRGDDNDHHQNTHPAKNKQTTNHDQTKHHHSPIIITTSSSGVPLAFPQYREEGVLPDNGFAGRLPWEVVDAGLDTALLNAEGGLADVELPPGYSPEWTDAQLAEAIGAGADEDDEEEDDVEGGGGEEGEEGEEEGEEEEAEERGGGEQVSGASASADADAARQAFGIGAVGDPAPYVILRLADSAETRALGWPHAFELLLKVTLSEADDFANPKGDLRRGVFAYAGGAGVPHPASREEADVGAMLAMDAAELPDAAADAEPAMQLKLEFALRNPGGGGGSSGGAGGGGGADAPFEFQLGALSHFATRDLNRHGDFVKVLGLGGANTLDYGADPRFAQLGFVNDDYVHFGGEGRGRERERERACVRCCCVACVVLSLLGVFFFALCGVAECAGAPLSANTACSPKHTTTNNPHNPTKTKTPEKQNRPARRGRVHQHAPLGRQALPRRPHAL
jgi:hypothetical protein